MCRTCTGDDILQIGPHERLPARELDRMDIELARHPDESLDLERGHLLAVGRAGPGHRPQPLVVAVDAGEVASLGHADADIGDPASVRVDQHLALSSGRPPLDLTPAEAGSLDTESCAGARRVGAVGAPGDDPAEEMSATTGKS